MSASFAPFDIQDKKSLSLSLSMVRPKPCHALGANLRSFLSPFLRLSQQKQRVGACVRVREIEKMSGKIDLLTFWSSSVRTDTSLVR